MPLYFRRRLDLDPLNVFQQERRRAEEKDARGALKTIYIHIRAESQEVEALNATRHRGQRRK
jgi:hypothetical protein